MISFKNTHPDFNELASKEWLVANGIGGYASSTVVGANTRRYHGLLVASLNPPTARTVMVSKVEECIVFNRDCAFGLSSNQYPGAVHPHGFQYFKFFERKPLPRMKFEAHGHHLLKTVFMTHGSNTTVVLEPCAIKTVFSKWWPCASNFMRGRGFLSKNLKY